jgi:tRNA(Ile)-lysidine synthase
VGVAVSGGGDSLALLHLLHRAATHRGIALSAVTVDHRLRPESSAEAAGVARFCAGLVVPHDILVWDHGNITGNLMDQARQARLRLMADWARTRGISRVALGHTADDQAETFLMGLARSSGLDGLVGLRGLWSDHGVTWMRPLLNHTRDELRRYLLRQGIDWIDDPTNDDDRYERARARKALAALHPVGISAERLVKVIGHLQSAQEALQDRFAQFLGDEMDETAGALIIRFEPFFAAPDEFRRRFLAGAIRWMNGGARAPRSPRIATLEQALSEGRAATLGGVQARIRRDHIILCREADAAGRAVANGSVWDHRWQVTGPMPPGYAIRALGAAGLSQLPGWRDHGIPREILLTTPAIWDGARLVAAPLLEKTGQWQAKLRPSFGEFILSH